MKYIIMENHLSYSVVLDEEGNFIKVANMGFEVGDRCDEIYPITETKKTFNTKRILASVSTLAACLLIFVTSVLNGSNYYGMVYMDINPSVAMKLDQEGLVKKVKGANEDGRKLVRGYRYKNKDINTVSKELINKAVELEYLSKGGKISINVESDDEEWEKTTGKNIRKDLYNSEDDLSDYEVNIKVKGKVLDEEDDDDEDEDNDDIRSSATKKNKDGSKRKDEDIRSGATRRNDDDDDDEEDEDIRSSATKKNKVKEKISKKYDDDEDDNDDEEDNDDIKSSATKENKVKEKEYKKNDDDKEDDYDDDEKDNDDIKSSATKENKVKEKEYKKDDDYKREKDEDDDDDDEDLDKKKKKENKNIQENTDDDKDDEEDDD